MPASAGENDDGADRPPSPTLFFFTYAATPERSPLPLHAALPISVHARAADAASAHRLRAREIDLRSARQAVAAAARAAAREIQRRAARERHAAVVEIGRAHV